jgi:hypothetical protein
MLALAFSPAAGGLLAWRGVTMRRHVLVATLVTFSLVVAVVSSSASALVKPRVFTLLEVEGHSHPLGDFTFDQPPAPGDQFVATNTLYRWTGMRGIRVGHDRVLFTFITGYGKRFSHRATFLFQGQVYLPDGTVFVEGFGSFPPRGPARLQGPVLGGTGIYENARGYLNVRAGRRTLLEFHLTP